MTRDGDVIEIGCHTGSKTWSLRCESNEWIGVLGQCGVGRFEIGTEVAHSSISAHVSKIFDVICC